MADHGGDLFKGFFLGSIVGVALGVLFAPRSGKDIRENLRGESDDLLDKAKSELENIKNELNELGSKISETIEKGKGIFETKESSEEKDFEAEIQSDEEKPEQEDRPKTARKKRAQKKEKDEA